MEKIREIRYQDRIDYVNDDGKLHRLDGPARIYNCGNKEWYFLGERHRLDGPALEYNDGYKAWYKDNRAHRQDGPAIETGSRKEWYIDGLRHRIGGPAYEDELGNKYYYQKGVLHRLDGPAIDVNDLRKEWYFKGTAVDCSNKETFLKIIKEKYKYEEESE